jgi:hypothetical protein
MVRIALAHRVQPHRRHPRHRGDWLSAMDDLRRLDDTR